MEKVLFSKYSNERSPLFSIVTQIIREEQGRRIVRKAAAGQAAIPHIEKIGQLGMALQTMLRGTDFMANVCLNQKAGYIDFEYLTGDTLEAVIDGLLEQEKTKEAEHELTAYMDQLVSLAKEDFEKTKDFTDVFGDQVLPAGMKSMAITDIDLIPANIMIDRDKKCIIDFEWSFDFPIPVSFVLYRIIFYYVNEKRKQMGLDDQALYSRYGIDDQLKATYYQMELGFQHYIEGSHIPVRNMYPDISPGVWSFETMTEAYREEFAGGSMEYLQVYTAKDGQFTEAGSYLRPLENKHFEGVIELSEDEDSLRLDPCGRPCMVTLNVFAPEGSETPVIKADTNGRTFDGIHYIFNNNDPMFVLTGLGENEKKILVDLEIEAVYQNTADQLVQDADAEHQKQAELQAEIEHLKNLIQLKQDELDAIKATKVWRAYQKYSVARQKMSDPFGRSRQNLAVKEKKQPIRCSVDQVKMVGGRPQIQGWSVGEFLDQGIQVVDSAGNPVETEIHRMIRLDVNQVLGLEDENFQSGYAISIGDSCTEQYVKVVFTSEDDQCTLDVDLGTAARPKEYDAWIREKIASVDKKRSKITDGVCITAAVFDKKHQKDCQLIQSLKNQKYEALSVVDFTELAAVCSEEKDLYVLFAYDNLELREDALAKMNSWIKDHPGTDLLYTDEDCYDPDADCYYDPAFKTDFNIDLLRSTNYIGSMLLVKKDLLKAALTSETMVGQYDFYDLILRCVEKAAQIGHIPEVLGHLYKTKQFETWCQAPEERDKRQTEAVSNHLKRMGYQAQVLDTEVAGVKRIQYLHEEEPLISIIIPNKDHVEDLSKCIQAIEEKSDYKNYEYIIVENNSTEKETFKYYNALEASNDKVHVVYFEGEFNYSAINNFGARYAKGDYFLLLNNDIEMVSGDSLRSMLGYCMRKDVGIVGARLYYPDDTIQHAGVILGIGGVAGHAFAGFPKSNPGPGNRIVAASDLSAVTAACLMVSREAYETVGGLTEEFKVAFNDVDFCLKVRRLGYLVVYDPAAILYHYESKSRGYEDTPEKIARFQGEINSFMDRWSDLLVAGDPYYNTNLTLDRQDFSLK